MTNFRTNYDNDAEIINSLPHKHILVGVKDGEKIVKGNTKGAEWDLQKATTKLPYFQKIMGDYEWSIMLSVNLENSGVFCLDIDAKEIDGETDYFQQLEDEFSIFEYCIYSRGTTKGYHCFFVENEEVKGKIGKKSVKINEKYQIDLITDHIWMKIDEEFEKGFCEDYSIEEFKEVFTDKPFNSNDTPEQTAVQGEQSFTAEAQTTISEVINDVLGRTSKWVLEDKNKFVDHINNHCTVDHLHHHDSDSHSCVFVNVVDDKVFLVAQCFSHGKTTLKLNRQQINKLKVSMGFEIEEAVEDEEVVMKLEKLYRLNSEIEMPDELKIKLDMYDKVNKAEQKTIDKLHMEFKKQCFDDEIKKKANYFEKFHFKVMSPPCFGRKSYNKTSLVSASELELQYENVKVQGKTKFTQIWRELVEIRTFENVDFLPNPLPCPEYTFNTFNGLRAERLSSCEAKDIDLFLNHIKILTGNHEAGTQYLINYLAHAVQKPGELPRVGLVFQSDQGTGKNVFFENFVKYLLGNDYLLQTAEMDKVIGRFSMINNKLFVIMDETSGKDSFTNSDKIKNIITAEQVAWERKGIDGIKINNCGRYLFFSNNDTPVKIESSDRRFVVFKCSNDRQNDTTYFAQMVKLFKDDDVIKTLYSYLMNIDISNWDSVLHRPITEAYQDIQSANIPPMAKWLEEKYYDFNHTISMSTHSEDELLELQEMQSKELYTEYKQWLDSNGFKKMEYNTTKFGREIGKYDGICKKRKTSGIHYAINYEDLKTFLIKKKYMECMVEE